jgi:hypothetical protein
VNDEDFDDFFRVAHPRLVAMGLAMSTERHAAQELAQETRPPGLLDRTLRLTHPARVIIRSGSASARKPGRSRPRIHRVVPTVDRTGVPLRHPAR